MTSTRIKSSIMTDQNWISPHMESHLGTHHERGTGKVKETYPATIKQKSREQNRTIAGCLCGGWGGVRAVSFIPIQRANLITRGEGNSN